MKTSTTLDQAHVYTDLAALQKLKGPGIDRSQAIEGVARQFESMMVNLMLKSMRQANSVFAEGNMFHEPATELYQEMLDHQLSLTMTREKGMGLAEMLVKQLTRRESGESVPALYKSLEDYPRSQAVMSKVTVPAGQDFDASEPAELTEEEVGVLEQVAYYAEQLGAVEAATEEISEVKGAPDVLPQSFESPEEFIARLMPVAEKVAAEMGVDPRVLLAQSALETGWGRHMIQDGERVSFNLFGIKADQRWDGDVVWTNTTEYRGGVAMKERAGFRAYNSYEESFADYLQFLKGNPRYEKALNLAKSPELYTEALQKAGYATDPQYAEKINRIINGGWFDAVESDKETESTSGKGLPAGDIEARITDAPSVSEQI